MYLIKGKDLYTAVKLIGRLPVRYIKNGNMYDGVYVLSGAERVRICTAGIIFEELINNEKYL